MYSTGQIGFSVAHAVGDNKRRIRRLLDPGISAMMIPVTLRSTALVY
jgi:hypothetical protein